MMVVVLLCVYQGDVIFSPEISSKNLALAIQKEYQPGQTIVIYRNYEAGSTLKFNTEKKFTCWTGCVPIGGSDRFSATRPTYLKTTIVPAPLERPNRVYFFAQEDSVEKALNGIDPKTVHIFARSGGKVVLTNQATELEHAPQPSAIQQ